MSPGFGPIDAFTHCPRSQAARDFLAVDSQARRRANWRVLVAVFRSFPAGCDSVPLTGTALALAALAELECSLACGTQSVTQRSVEIGPRGTRRAESMDLVGTAVTIRETPLNSELLGSGFSSWLWVHFLQWRGKRSRPTCRSRCENLG